MTLRERIPHVLIIGGGLAGTATALRLLKDVNQRLRLTVVESRATVGRGLAYSTAHREHLVNGVARMFSVYDDEPDHLVDWLQAAANAGGWQPPAGVAWSGSLPPRQVYGDYLQSTLARALVEAADRVNYAHRRTRAIDVERLAAGPAAYRVTLADDSHLHADAVVLATGVFSRPLGRQRFVVDGAVESAPGYIADIWARGAWDAVADDEHIVYLGAGLSALDSLIIAEKGGFRGQHTVLSRRGLAVQSRADVEPWPDFLRYDPAAPSLRALVRQIQQQRHEIRARGESWQRLVAAIRPHVPALWSAASDRDRRRFLGRLRSYWESSLHRSAGAPLAWQTAVAEQGRFAHHAGHIESVSLRDDGRFDITWRPAALAHGHGGQRETDPARSADSVASADSADAVNRVDQVDQLDQKRRTVVADRVVNCLGFEFDWHKVDDPLVRQLLVRGLVSAHRSGFGISVTADDHAVIGADGEVQPGLHAVGHALRGLIWESNAIPEHVPQAGTVGRSIVLQLALGGGATEPSEPAGKPYEQAVLAVAVEATEVAVVTEVAEVASGELALQDAAR